MGIFSSADKVTIATYVSRVVTDDAIPNCIKTAVARAVVTQTSYPENIALSLSNSMGVRAEKMYEYGKTSYHFGLPTGHFHVKTQGLDKVQAVLNSLVGSTVELDYYRFAPPNALHIAWLTLVRDYGYKSSTNQLDVLSALKKVPVYLENLTVVVPTASLNTFQLGSLDQWGTPAKAGESLTRNPLTPAVGYLLQHTPIQIDELATELHVRVDYTWDSRIGADPNSIPADYEFPIANVLIKLTGYLPKEDYYHVKYSVGENDVYWMYKRGNGTYPTLDTEFSNTVLNEMGEFFPIAHFRNGTAAMNADKTSAAYKTSKKLVEYLGMDYDQIIEGVNENPDVADIYQAMVMLAVPATTTDPLECSYLYKFFNELHLAEPEQLSSPTVRQIQADLNDPGYQETPFLARHVIIIQDALFKMELSNGGIYKKRRVGKLGPIGTHTATLENSSYSFPSTRWVGGGESGYLEAYMETVGITYHCYRKQVASSLYDEIKVNNLQMMYYIPGGTGGFATISDGDDTTLLIPLDRSITKTMKLREREQLYSRSLHYIFTSIVITKLAWYQLDAFKFIMMAVMMVVAAWTLGGNLAKMGPILAGMSTSAIVYLAAYEMASYILIAVALKLVVRSIGIKNAFLVALIATAIAMYSMVNTGSLQGAPWAQELLSLSSGLISAGKAVLQADMQDLLGEAQAFALYAENAYADLSKSNDLLKESNSLMSFIVKGESAQAFLDRMLSSVNSTEISIAAISSYVDVALTLPTISATLGD